MAAITICRSTRASATRRVSRDVAAARGRGEKPVVTGSKPVSRSTSEVGTWHFSRSSVRCGVSQSAAGKKKKHRVFDESRGIFSRTNGENSRKKGRFVSRRPKSTPDASFLHSLFHPFDAFPPAGRSSSIHAGTSGALQRSRCYGVRRRGGPPLRCVTNARSNPENSGARGSRRDLVAPRPARLFPSSL